MAAIARSRSYRTLARDARTCTLRRDVSKLMSRIAQRPTMPSSDATLKSHLTKDVAEAFMEDGFLHLPGIVSPELVRTARRTINLTIGSEGIDKDKISTFSSQSWVPSICNHSSITDLLNGSDLLPTLRAIFGGDVFPPAAAGQIALRFPVALADADAIRKRPSALRWGGHLDGLHTPLNGVPKGVLATFSMLVGVALSDQLESDCGNLGVLKVLFAHRCASISCASETLHRVHLQGRAQACARCFPCAAAGRGAVRSRW
eukprot:SAG31_NODE_435_length_15733_cov_6.508251_5_plen_260_part_00